MNCIHSILTKNTIKDGWLCSSLPQGGLMPDTFTDKLTFLSDFLFPDLPKQQRICFVSNAIYGRKFTASLLELSPNTVKFHVRQAKEKLRSLRPNHDPYDEFIHRMFLFVSFYHSSIDKKHD